MGGPRRQRTFDGPLALLPLPTAARLRARRIGAGETSPRTTVIMPARRARPIEQTTLDLVEMPKTAREPIIDAWAQPVLKAAAVPEVVRLFERSGSAHLLGRSSRPRQMVDLDGRSRRRAGDAVRLVPPGAVADHQRSDCRVRAGVSRAVRRRGDRRLGKAAWRRCASWIGPSTSWAAGRCASCRGCGSCRPTTSSTIPLYVKCIELGIPFCTQVGHTGPLMPSETGRPVPYLDEVALTFPELTHRGRAHRPSLDRRDDRRCLEAR